MVLSYFNALIVVEARRNDTSFIYQENCTLEDVICKYMCVESYFMNIKHLLKQGSRKIEFIRGAQLNIHRPCIFESLNKIENSYNLLSKL